MKSIDLMHAVESPKVDNFTCQLFRLIMKADSVNRTKLATLYPIEVEMVVIFKTPGLCPYKDETDALGIRLVDWEKIEAMAMEGTEVPL